MNFIGLMSGTSLDGVDGVIACFEPQLQIRAFVHHAFEPAERAELFALQSVCENELARSRVAGVALAQAYAHVVHELLDTTALQPADIEAIGAHGQTIRHAPQHGYTVQLLEPARLAALTRIDVVHDFRAADIAYGGQGAPLVPAFHAAVFGGAARVVCNIGGIANVSLLASGEPVRGYDTGPGNCLMDYWIGLHQGREYDADGAWAASAAVDDALLARLLAEPYFAQPAPKSTGRDLFNPAWLQSKLAPGLSPAAVQSTLCELTARSIAQALGKLVNTEVLLCGGGARNLELRRRLALHLGFAPKSTADFGLPVDAVEAAAFAWLAKAFCEGKTASLPAVTGARHAAVLGALSRRLP